MEKEIKNFLGKYTAKSDENSIKKIIIITCISKHTGIVLLEKNIEINGEYIRLNISSVLRKDILSKSLGIISDLRKQKLSVKVIK